MSAPGSASRAAASQRSDPAIVELRSVGTGRPFVRALARMIVRRELIFARLIPDPDGCVTGEQAG